MKTAIVIALGLLLVACKPPAPVVHVSNPDHLTAATVGASSVENNALYGNGRTIDHVSMVVKNTGTDELSQVQLTCSLKDDGGVIVSQYGPSVAASNLAAGESIHVDIAIENDTKIVVKAIDCGIESIPVQTVTTDDTTDDSTTDDSSTDDTTTDDTTTN